MAVKIKLGQFLSGRTQSAAAPTVYEKNPPPHIVQGVRQLQARRQFLWRTAILLMLLLPWVFLLLAQLQDWINGYLGWVDFKQGIDFPPLLYQQLQQQNMLELGQAPDFFFNGLWWILRFLGVIGLARWINHLLMNNRLKKQSFVKRGLFNLLTFLLLWNGSGYLLHGYQERQQEQAVNHQLVGYEHNAARSEIARFMQQNHSDALIQDYVLAQTILARAGLTQAGLAQAGLAQTQDKAAAAPYVQALVDAEGQPNFDRYQFEPGILWQLQHNIYGRAVTPQAQAVEDTALRASHIDSITKMMARFILVLNVLAIVVLYGLQHLLAARIKRIKAVYDN